MPRSSRWGCAWLGAIAFLAANLAAHAEPGQFSERWETLTGCQLVDSEWNDGDSFHIRHAGKEYIFRLYFVDTPEVHDVSPGKSRTTEQARYWKINKATLHGLAVEAVAFSKARLKGAPFTVRTRWEDAKGQSKLPRNFAVIETSTGDLAELLVANGLARIYGHYLEHPTGASAARYRAKLQQLEEKARSGHLGAWSGQPAGPGPKSEPARRKSVPKPTKSGADIPAF